MPSFWGDDYCFNFTFVLDGVENRVAKSCAWSHNASNFGGVSFEPIDGNKLVLGDGEYSIWSSLEVIEELEMGDVEIFCELISIKGAPFADIGHENGVIWDGSCNSNGCHFGVVLNVFQKDFQSLLKHIVIFGLVLVLLDEDGLVGLQIDADKLESNVGASYIPDKRDVLVLSLHVIL